MFDGHLNLKYLSISKYVKKEKNMNNKKQNKKKKKNVDRGIRKYIY